MDRNCACLDVGLSVKTLISILQDDSRPMSVKSVVLYVINIYKQTNNQTNKQINKYGTFWAFIFLRVVNSLLMPRNLRDMIARYTMKMIRHKSRSTINTAAKIIIPSPIRGWDLVVVRFACTLLFFFFRVVVNNC